MMSEKEIEKGFETLLNKHCVVFWRKIWQGPMSRTGFPDNVVTFRWRGDDEGFTLLLEAKRYGKELTRDQEETLREHARAGGIGGLLTINKEETHFIIEFIVCRGGQEFIVPASIARDGDMYDVATGLSQHPRIDL